MKKKKKPSYVMTLRLPAQIAGQIRRRAANRKMTIAAYMRCLIERVVFKGDLP